ncbi:MAG: hypothetical protein RJB66_286 [Pseudomonadota bacterium]|jgi:phosphoglycolate phosphatase
MIRLYGHLQHKKHIIFDYNGTILYDTELCVEALNILLESQDLPEMSEDDYREQFHFPIASFYQKVGFDFSKESFEAMGERYMSHYKSNLHRVKVYHGLRDLLVELKKRDMTTSILTALNQEILHHQLEEFGLNNLFDNAFGLPDLNAASKIARGKELMLHVGIPAEDCLIIGDTDHDLEVAEALGIDALLLADGHQAEERLRQTKAKVINLQRKPEK